MISENKAMEQFAENLWTNFLQKKTEEMIANGLHGFRAVVTGRQGNGIKLIVQRPFDNDSDGNPVSMTLPCVASMSTATVGTQVLCVYFGTISNAFVLCKADLSNL